MKRIIITGASGLVASELTLFLLHNTNYQIFLISTNVEKIENRYSLFHDRVKCFTLSSFREYTETISRDFDICIHTAFSRASSGILIVDSIHYQIELLSIIKQISLLAFVNISSQSVYGQGCQPLWTEDIIVNPDYIYAMGKYNAEILTELFLKDTLIRWTNVRLASIASNANFLKIFVKSMVDSKPIFLTTPNRTCSFIDVRDVVSGLVAMISNIDNITSYKYNLGSNVELSIYDIAKEVVNVGYNTFNLKKVEIQIEDNGNHSRVGMDSSLFCKTFNWQPKYSIEEMVVPMFRLLLE